MRSLGVTYDHMQRERRSPRAAFIFRVSAAAMTMFLAWGCAAPKPLTAQEQIAVWLSESPRTIAVSVDPVLPEASLVSRNHHGGERVGRGVAAAGTGAVASILVGCVSIPLFGCFFGVVAAPVVAVYGAVRGATSVQSTDQYHPLAAAQGAPEMLTGNGVIDLPAMLATAVSERPVRAHTLRAVQYGKENESLSAAEVTLRLRFYAFQLLGDVGNDPEVALQLKVASEVQTSTSSGVWGEYSYAGSRRRVSSWRADDTRLFREEINLAVRSLATDIAKDLGSPHSLAATFKAEQNAVHRSTTAYRYPAGAYAPRRDHVPNLRELGKIEDGDIFPAGGLYADHNSVSHTPGDDDIEMWFVVKLPSPSAKGEGSYAAKVKINCSAGAFSVDLSMTSATEYGSFPAITWQEHSPPLVVDKPSAPLASAVRAVCK
jgi:hypothetical protein